MSGRRLTLFIVCLLGLTTPGPGSQAAPPIPDAAASAAPSPSQTPRGSGGATTEDLAALRETLRDPAQRERFLNRLDALIEARRESGSPAGSRSVFGVLGQGVGAVGERFSVLEEALRRIPLALSEGLRWLRSPANARQAVAGIVTFSVVLGPALLVLIALHWLVRRLAWRLAPTGPIPVAWRLVLLTAGSLLASVPGVAAGAVGAGLALLGPPPEVARLVAVALVAGTAAVAVVTGVSRTLLAPRSGPGLPGLERDTGRAMHGAIRRFAIVLAFGGVAVALTARLATDSALWRLGYKALALVVVLMALGVMFRHRSAVAHWLRGGRPEATPRGRLAANWHMAGSALLLAAWAAVVLGGDRSVRFVIEAGLLSAVVVILAAVANAAFRLLLRRVVGAISELSQRFPELNGRSGRYLPLVRRFGSTVIWTLALLALLQAWGLRGLEWMLTPTGRIIGATVASVVVIVGISLLVCEVVLVMLERGLRGRGRSARGLTILPLARNALYVTVFAVAGLMVLAELGVNIGPFLAGAGVLGIAIGFGAQSLVQDVITGFFILVEDSIAVGDWVDLGEHAGEVETLSLRTLRLRDLEGCLHAVPFSRVGTVVNMSRDFNFAMIDLRLGYETDLDAAVRVLESVDDALRDDPDWAPLVTGPLEVFGLNRIADSALELRVRWRTRPGQHWAVRRELLNRVRVALGDAGIELPLPRQNVYLSRGAPLGSPEHGEPDTPAAPAGGEA